MAAIVSVSLSAGINAKFLPAGLGDVCFFSEYSYYLSLSKERRAIWPPRRTLCTARMWHL